MSKRSAQARKATSPPAPKARARKAVMRIEDRIPVMTDVDLTNLQANAVRLAASAATPQQADARRLLPIISAEVDARALARAKDLASRRAALREGKRQQAPVRR